MKSYKKEKLFMGDLKEKQHYADLCVVGGGLAGMCAAISAARHGCQVVLMHDRPVLGGNASSEIRMWPLGCHGKNNRETGIFEEILLENMFRNPTKNYSLWDSILYEKVRFEPNITLLLNCSCTSLEMEENRIQQIRGWQLTTYTWHQVEAKYFADCSGDSIL
ncbi:MAG TPA: FAD-binding dehydrogenase, partial [Prolixibacteraceae bacterium]|nr:FAD-binding dehydrogenase [Prolixibacteraceae bacterium]